MIGRSRVSLVGLAVGFGVALGGLGCDAGGLLVAESKGSEHKGPPANELVSAGTFASNGKYKLFYVVGQPTPQGVTKGPSHQLNGGLTGAVNSQ